MTDLAKTTLELGALPPPSATHEGHRADRRADRSACLLDLLGLAICAGDLARGSVVRIDQLKERYGVSRSVVREAIRVLASMGMVASRRRVGVQVLPETEWNLYDPQVIRWRLASRPVAPSCSP